jgi:hypothetical protein
VLSWAYFKVFEPLGLALWSSHDPLAQLAALPGMQCKRRLVFFGNFQVIVATKMAAAHGTMAQACAAAPVSAPAGSR